jgi:glycosyltransferase involved in cell wall biosynthesis
MPEPIPAPSTTSLDQNKKTPDSQIPEADIERDLSLLPYLAESAEFDLVVADASWIWTERRFQPLADHQGVRVLLLKACDWRNAVQQKKAASDWWFPLRQLGPNLWEQTLILPPGWMKSYPSLGMRPLASAVGRWRKRFGGQRPLALAISYPHYLRLRDLLKPDALIYYNMDDYGFYWGSRRESVRLLEERSVREADLSLVCAKLRAEQLAEAVPEASSKIVHLPHGAPASAIPSSPRDRPAEPPNDIADLPRPLLGFVGSLEDRIDWELIETLAREFPEGSIVLVGREPSLARNEGWHASYQSALALPNVHVLGWRPQEQISGYNASFDVCLIPYRMDHPFNIAACPTKVMDYMAGTRPVVSTALPECRLYASLFDVAESHTGFIAAVRQIVDRGSDDGRANLRWETALGSTWEKTSEAMLHRILSATDGRLCVAARR